MAAATNKDSAPILAGLGRRMRLEKLIFSLKSVFLMLYISNLVGHLEATISPVQKQIFRCGHVTDEMLPLIYG